MKHLLFKDKEVSLKIWLQAVQNCWLRTGIKLDRREADLFRLVVDAQEERRFAPIDADAHHNSVADSLGDRNLVASDHAIVAGRAPVFLKLGKVVELVLVRVLLPVGIIVP